MRGRFVFSVSPFGDGVLGFSSEQPLVGRLSRSRRKPDLVADRSFQAVASWFPRGRGAVSLIRIMFMRIESAARTIGGAGSFYLVSSSRWRMGSG
jgi:hypothetical protein